MSESGPETPLQDEIPPDRRRSGWWYYVLLLCIVAVVVAGLSRWWLPLWAGGVLENAASRQGVELERMRVDLGLTRGRLEEVEGTASGGSFRVDEAIVSWDVATLAQGELSEVTVRGLEATVDVGRFWPVRERSRPLPTLPAPPSPVDEEGEATPPVAERIGEAGPASAFEPPPAPPPERPSRPAPRPIPESTVASWKDLPFDALFISDARLVAAFGDSSLPLDAQLSYTDDGLTREAWARIAGDGLTLEASAREVASAMTWTAQGQLESEEPVNLLERFFPRGHGAHPEALRSWGVAGVTMENVRAEGVVRGGGDRWAELGLLFEGGRATLRTVRGGALDLSEWILALRGGPDELEFNAGLAVASWHEGPWSAQDFQLTLERDANGSVRLETPRVDWAHTAGISGTMTARFFSHWPPRPGGLAVEAQVAFGELVTPLLSLQPFRFFFNFDGQTLDGRVSTLESTAGERWALSDTRIRASGLHRPGGWKVAFETLLEDAPRAEGIVQVTGNLRQNDTRGGLSSAGTVGFPDGPVAAEWEGATTPGGESVFQAAETWSIDEVLPSLAKIWPALEAWRGGGRLEWHAGTTMEGDDPRSFEGELEARLNRISLENPGAGWAVEGIDGEVTLEARPFPRSAGAQVITAEVVRMGAISLSEVEARVSWPVMNRLRVEGVSAAGWGGVVRVESFAFDPRVLKLSPVIVFEGLDPDRARALFPFLPEATEGELYGRWELTCESGQWTAGRLSLRLETAQGTTWTEERSPSSGFLRELVDSLRPRAGEVE